MTPSPARRSLLLRRVLPALALVLVAGVVAFLGLRGDGDDAPAAAAASTSAAAAPTPQEAEEGPTASPSPATEEPAASVVARDGVPASARTVEVTAADFAAPASWSDGATIRVTGARQQVTTGTGPGERTGQPQTVFTLELTNHTDAPLDLGTVVVQATYGAPPAQASPIYDGQSADFGGALAPGASATAVYSFAIPADRLGDVALSVDVDGYRFPAVFRGAVPAR